MIIFLSKSVASKFGTEMTKLAMKILLGVVLSGVGEIAAAQSDLPSRRVPEESRIEQIDLPLVQAKYGHLTMLGKSSDDEGQPDFYLFQVVSLDPHSPLILENIAINKWTADVWNTFGECRRWSSTALSEAQRELINELNVSVREFTKLRDKRPMCYGEFEKAK